MTHQLVVIGGVYLPGLRELPLFALKAPSFHLLVRHELYRAIADANKGQRCTLVQAAKTLSGVDGPQAV